MSEDQALALTASLGSLTLVGASLLTRRLSLSDGVKLALVWIVIFALGFTAVSFFK